MSLPCYLEAMTYILWLLITFPSKALPQIFRLVMLAWVHNRNLDIYLWVSVHCIAMLVHSESYEHQSLLSFKPLVSKNVSWQVKLDTALFCLYLNFYWADLFSKLTCLKIISQTSNGQCGSSDPIQAFPYWWFKRVPSLIFITWWFLIWGFNKPLYVGENHFS